MFYPAGSLHFIARWTEYQSVRILQIQLRLFIGHTRVAGGRLEEMSPSRNLHSGQLTIIEKQRVNKYTEYGVHLYMY
jgi:hypothetical protein